MQMLRIASISIAAYLAAGCAIAQEVAKGTSARNATNCVTPAAKFHKVNGKILEAILMVESGSNPQAVGINTNGTTDLGIGQINSIHFEELKKYGIAPANLLSPCIGTYVAAWHLSKQYARYGNTWFAIGAYHSVTPEHNLRYQTLVYEQVKRMGG
jgi:soluble lytic murein transglycosylase-like protein